MFMNDTFTELQLLNDRLQLVKNVKQSLWPDILQPECSDNELTVIKC